MKTVNEVYSTTNSDTDPEYPTPEELPVATIMGHCQRKLDNWISEPLMFHPLLTYDDIYTQHDYHQRK
jgi:hypothetical protein